MSHTGSWVWDVRDARPVYWSAQMCRMHGRDVAQGPPSIGEYRALHRPEDWLRWTAELQRCVQDRTDLDFDCDLVLPDAIVKRIRVRGTPIAAADDDVTEIIGSTTELGDPGPGTEHPRREVKERYRQVIDLIPALTWSCRPEGTADYFNQGWLDYTGLSAKEAMDWGWTAAFHSDDLDAVIAYWESLLAAGTAGEIESRLRRFDGEYRWFLFRVRPLRDDRGRIVKWYGTNTDIEDRKRAEEALRDSERQLRQLVETIPALIWRGTSQGALDYLNRRHTDYLGKTTDELSDGRWMDLVHPDHRAATVERWLHSANTGLPYEDVYQLRRADGQYRWIQSVGEPFRDSEGRITHWYGMVTDIDDRKRAEDALRESERNLRLIFDTIPALACTMTATGELDRVNRQVLDYFGKTLEELKNWAFIGAVHDQDLEGVLETWRRSVGTGQTYEIEHRIRRADGVFRWFHVRGLPLRSADGQIVHWYVLLIDVEDRRCAEEAVRASEARLRLIIDTIPALVWRATPDGEPDYLNARVVTYTGRAVEAAERFRWEDLIHPNDLDSTTKAWVASINSGAPHHVKLRLRGADGIYRWFQVSAAPLRDESGKIVHWFGLDIDIDDNVRITDELRQTQARLSRATQIAAIAELSASIAHEINQPLAAAVANGHACQTWLLAEPPNIERARLTAGRMIRDANTVAEVVRKIRSLYKQTAPNLAPVDINDLILAVLKLTTEELRELGIGVETDLASGLPTVEADRVQIQQALLNLLHNAIEAMEGIVERPRVLAVISQLESGDLLVRIRDTGCGITQPTLIFDPFFTTKESGMGMGLSICRSIVESHGGRLWATPNDGAGTTFSFTLPVHREVSA